MQELRNKASELLSAGVISLVIGYSTGKGSQAKAIFITAPVGTEKLIYDQTCLHNLAVYLHKPEIKAFGKIALIANFPALRTVLQLASENQLTNENLTVITVNPEGKVILFNDFNEISEYVIRNFAVPASDVSEKIRELQSKTREERWEFWLDELGDCIKCYACRSACPLCYCTQCTVECNKPQWIPTSSHTGGNLEWHVLRAMHLAGRCIGCGECVRACPMDIPLGLLTAKLNIDIKETFNQVPGMKIDLDYALSSFKVDDKENFIR